MSNYRPITVLPVLSKILERFVHTQIYNYQTENKILSSQQFGFRPKLSTSTALALFTDRILENNDNGHLTASVFLDLSKAFDTVDHAILLHKLRSVRLDDNSLRWFEFESYLTSRQQITSINNTLSSSLSVLVGVPQGSILGPLLFIIYINDMPNVVKHCKIILYTDDTLLYYSSTFAKDIEKYVNEDLNLISQWLDENMLTLNCKKIEIPPIW
jgi:retron-type reverse transcriptase